MEFEQIIEAINEFGFPVVLGIGMGYFIYFIWKFVTDQLEPKLEEMHYALIKCIDANRMLDNDMIRLQQKVQVVLIHLEHPLAWDQLLNLHRMQHLPSIHRLLLI